MMICTEVITEILTPSAENLFEQNGQTRKQMLLRFTYDLLTSSGKLIFKPSKSTTTY